MTHTPQDGRAQDDRVEGSLADGGSLPGNRHMDEDRSFGAGRDSQDEDALQGGPVGGASGSTGASKAAGPGGDAHLGTGGMGGSAGGDQLTSTPQDGRRDTGQPK